MRDDPLRNVILEGLRAPLTLESGSIPTASSQLEAASAAVRAFLVSDEAVEAAAISMWQQESLRAADRKRSIAWEDEATDIREKWRQLARAALTVAVGDGK